MFLFKKKIAIECFEWALMFSRTRFRAFLEQKSKNTSQSNCGLLSDLKESLFNYPRWLLATADLRRTFYYRHGSYIKSSRAITLDIKIVFLVARNVKNTVFQTILIRFLGLINSLMSLKTTLIQLLYMWIWLKNATKKLVHVFIISNDELLSKKLHMDSHINKPQPILTVAFSTLPSP